MEVPNFSDREHIEDYKHGLRSIFLTKILATKRLDLVDDLLNTSHDFIKGEFSVQSKHDHLENRLGKCKNKYSFPGESS